MWITRRFLARIAVLTPVVVVMSAASIVAQETATPSSGSALNDLLGLNGENMGAPLRALAIVTIFGVVPSAVLLTTCFPRILVVLCFLRRALGT